jgi:hypothetical protein
MRTKQGVAVLNFETQVIRWAIFSCATASLLLLSACSGTSQNHNLALAPAPPVFDPYAVEEPLDMATIRPAGGFVTADFNPGIDRTSVNSLRAERQQAGCSTRERFDRKHLIAYQWGRTQENRVGLEIDGLGIDSMDVEAIKLEYTLRLQPHKTKKERCLSASNWQGMLGSAYNELYMREGNDTVWRDLREFRDDVESRVDTLLGN